MIDVTAEHDATEMLLLNKEDLERRVTESTNELQETNELMSLEIGERRRMEGELRTVRNGTASSWRTCRGSPTSGTCVPAPRPGRSGT